MRDKNAESSQGTQMFSRKWEKILESAQNSSFVGESFVKGCNIICGSSVQGSSLI